MIMDFSQSRELQRQSHKMIPGGAHTYAKGDDQYPEEAPGFIIGGNGCHVWDVDGNEFIEYGMGLRAVTLGHAHPAVVDAAYRQMLRGSNFTRPATIEMSCARQLLELVPGSEMVKFAKNGSDVTSAAVKLARAYTGRERVAICGDQPFLSTDDWFIGTTAMAAGVPKRVRELTIKFRYNDLASLVTLFEQYPNEIACVIMEAETTEAPRDGFLFKVRDLCHKHGALFILDEIITGFRWDMGGAQSCFGIEADLSTFGKALANGFSVAALVGKREFMQLGGLEHDRERVFLLSSTNGAETHALAAAIATMGIYRQEPVIGRLYQQGKRLQSGIERAIAEHKLQNHFGLLGRPCNLVYTTRDREGHRSQPFRTLFLQELIQRGILAPSFVVSYAHADRDIDMTISAVEEALAVYRRALNEGIDKFLVGRPVQPVFRTYN